MKFINLLFVLFSWFTLIKGRRDCSRHCSKSQCPDVSSCNPLHLIKDKCNCCFECVTAEALTPKPITGNPCEEITCPRFKICLKNIQGLPVCRCPSVIVCKSLKKDHVCGQNKVTYNNRCYMRAAECSQNQKIRMVYKGRCIENINEASKRQLARISRQQEKREKRRRRRMREKRRQQRQKNPYRWRH